jgi:hypothetical protein
MLLVLMSPRTFSPVTILCDDSISRCTTHALCDPHPYADWKISLTMCKTTLLMRGPSPQIMLLHNHEALAISPISTYLTDVSDLAFCITSNLCQSSSVLSSSPPTCQLNTLFIFSCSDSSLFFLSFFTAAYTILRRHEFLLFNFQSPLNSIKWFIQIFIFRSVSSTDSRLIATVLNNPCSWLHRPRLDAHDGRLNTYPPTAITPPATHWPTSPFCQPLG